MHCFLAVAGKACQGKLLGQIRAGMLLVCLGLELANWFGSICKILIRRLFDVIKEQEHYISVYLSQQIDYLKLAHKLKLSLGFFLPLFWWGL